MRIYFLTVTTIFLVLINFSQLEGQRIRIPKSHSNITSDNDGNLLLSFEGKQLIASKEPAQITLEKIIGNPQGTNSGIYFDFQDALVSGTLYFGFIPYRDSKHPYPVYFKQSVQILNGKAFINMMVMRGRYDMVKWEENGYGTLGYRVVDEEGSMLYDGKVSFTWTDTFKIDDTIIEGPFVNLLNPDGCTISCETNKETVVEIEVDGKIFKSPEMETHHEIEIKGLKPGKTYDYTIQCGTDRLSYSFKTAPLPGSRTSFVFAYASDSRAGQGGGERNIYGANAYIMKRIVSLSKYKEVAFLQFSGDMVNGYKTDPAEISLEYANWKKSTESFASFFPVVTTMGNHEALIHLFVLKSGQYFSIDKFPFDSWSSEKIYQDNFVNPMNGPLSEDGSSYDPDTKRDDFPSYKESVFYYVYDNVAMVVLNSNYWYAPTTSGVPVTSGNIHAYIMDNQLKWFEETMIKLEKDDNIDHIFLTQHTPFFPNGGHVGDDMWYNGDNSYRPYINGEPVEKGIIERRDELLDIFVNRSEKSVAILTGDEHNYCKTEITPETNLYPEGYQKPKIKLNRTIYQINNGAAGAPYYAQEKTPWTPFVSGFTTQNALVLFHVEGDVVFMEVFNPDTLEKFDEMQLR